MDLANHREKALMQHIEDLTHRIEFKGQLEQPIAEAKKEESIQPSTAPAQPEPGTTEPKDEGLTTLEQKENKRIAVLEHVEPEPPKRGFLSRFFLPNG